MSPSTPSPEVPDPDDRPLHLAADPVQAEAPATRSWKLLIVDDEREVHGVTQLALDGFEFHGRPLTFLHAYSGEEACQVARDTPDLAVILLDVVMEADDAGLRVVRYIRETLGNRFVRIILRTGQPGQAPEHRVITEYDINDYKHKTELTRQKLFTTVYTSLSSYRDLVALDANRRGLEHVIEASARIFELRSMDRFINGVLEQLTALLYLDQDAMLLRASSLAADGRDDGACEVVAATGRFRNCCGQTVDHCADSGAAKSIAAARAQREGVFQERSYVGYHQSDDGQEHFLYVEGETPICVPGQHLIDLFIRNVAIAYQNVRLLDRRGQQ